MLFQRNTLLQCWKITADIVLSADVRRPPEVSVQLAASHQLSLASSEPVQCTELVFRCPDRCVELVQVQVEWVVAIEPKDSCDSSLRNAYCARGSSAVPHACSDSQVASWSLALWLFLFLFVTLCQQIAVATAAAAAAAVELAQLLLRCCMNHELTCAVPDG